jgi:hypothetical protein
LLFLTASELFIAAGAAAVCSTTFATETSSACPGTTVDAAGCGAEIWFPGSNHGTGTSLGTPIGSAPRLEFEGGRSCELTCGRHSGSTMDREPKTAATADVFGAGSETGVVTGLGMTVCDSMTCSVDGDTKCGGANGTLGKSAGTYCWVGAASLVDAEAIAWSRRIAADGRDPSC